MKSIDDWTIYDEIEEDHKDVESIVEKNKEAFASAKAEEIKAVLKAATDLEILKNVYYGGDIVDFIDSKVKEDDPLVHLIGIEHTNRLPKVLENIKNYLNTLSKERTTEALNYYYARHISGGQWKFDDEEYTELINIVANKEPKGRTTIVDMVINAGR